MRKTHTSTANQNGGNGPNNYGFLLAALAVFISSKQNKK